MIRLSCSTKADDSTCDGAFEVLDQYVEAVLRGDDVTLGFARVLSHLRNCWACGEDTEGLLAAVREIERLSPEK